MKNSEILVLNARKDQCFHSWVRACLPVCAPPPATFRHLFILLAVCQRGAYPAVINSPSPAELVKVLTVLSLPPPPLPTFLPFPFITPTLIPQPSYYLSVSTHLFPLLSFPFPRELLPFSLFYPLTLLLLFIPPLATSSLPFLYSVSFPYFSLVLYFPLPQPFPSFLLSFIVIPRPY